MTTTNIQPCSICNDTGKAFGKACACEVAPDAARATLPANAGERKLTDERIIAIRDEVGKRYNSTAHVSDSGACEFARAIESELANAAPGTVIAWAHEDGRVISATTKANGERDGGAMASSLSGYTIPLGHITNAAPAGAVPEGWRSWVTSYESWQDGYGVEQSAKAPEIIKLVIERREIQLHQAEFAYLLDKMLTFVGAASPVPPVSAPAEKPSIRERVLRNEVAIIIGCDDGRSAEQKADSVISWIAKHGPEQAAPADQARDADGWQPIETAPKDGGRICLGRAANEEADQDEVFTIGHWQEGYEDGIDYMGCDSGFVDIDYQVFHGGRSFGSESRRYAPSQPTHWMPLPAPPALRTSPASQEGGAA
jgi:hypothetical protein